MVKTTNRFVALLLTFVLALVGSSLINAGTADAADKKVYEITYATEDLSTPMSWVQSPYFNNPQYKETQFENYNNNAPIPPGGARETAFYMVYREDGLYMFFQSTEPGIDANGNPLESWLEFYIATGEGDIPYHQMIVPTSGSPIEYYEWQTEFRNNRPLEGSVKVDSKPVPGGWGTVVTIPWEAVYDSLPLNGGNWQFNVIRWSPVDGQTWGGQVHQTGRFNLLHFQPPTTEQRMAIQRNLLNKAWNKFQTTSGKLTEYWMNNPATSEKAFYSCYVLPLIVKGSVDGAQISDLNSLNAEEIDNIFKNVPDWMELRYNVDDLRQSYVRKLLLYGNQPPTVTDETYVTKSNTPVSGVVTGTDADGDPLTYSLGTAPAHGTVTLDAYGNWTYTPSADYAGKDRFTIDVSDTYGEVVTSSIDLKITSGPVTTAVLDPALPNGSNGWYTSDVTVTLATTDDLIGVARTEYRIDNGNWNVYNGTIPSFGEGNHILEYRGIDLLGNEEATKSIPIKIDNTAPQLQVSLDKTVLSPPNHKLVPIQATLAYSDSTSEIASVVLTSITSNEADNGTGDGNTSDDIQGAEFGTEDTSFSLRAESSGGGSGRIYTVTYTVTDHAGLTTTSTVTVTVPHNN